MMDAVIDEIDGRMIRVGRQWLADFASCNYLGLRPRPRDHRGGPGVPRGVGNASELVAPAGQSGALRADRGAAHRAARQRGHPRAADDHAHPHVGDPACSPASGTIFLDAARTRRSTTAASSRARAARRSSASASRTPTTSRSCCEPSAPGPHRLHRRRQQHDRQRPGSSPRSRGSRASTTRSSTSTTPTASA